MLALLSIRVLIVAGFRTDTNVVLMIARSYIQVVNQVKITMSEDLLRVDIPLRR